MSDKVCAMIYVEGRVQGVGFRYFTEYCSQELGLAGYCKNLSDGRVLVEVEGGRDVVEFLIDRLRQGPPRARVNHVDVTWKAPTGRFPTFEIRYL